HQHVLRVDLIDRLLAFMKVGRWIDVSAPLADVAELIDVETVLGDRVERAHLHLTEALPVWRVGTERVREINEALGGERSIEARQVRSGPRGGAVARGVGGRRRWLRCRVGPAGGLYRGERAGAYGHEREQSGKARAIRHGTPPADATDYFGSRWLCQILLRSLRSAAPRGPVTTLRCRTDSNPLAGFPPPRRTARVRVRLPRRER